TLEGRARVGGARLLRAPRHQPLTVFVFVGYSSSSTSVNAPSASPPAACNACSGNSFQRTPLSLISLRSRSERSRRISSHVSRSRPMGEPALHRAAVAALLRGALRQRREVGGRVELRRELAQRRIGVELPRLRLRRVGHQPGWIVPVRTRISARNAAPSTNASTGCIAASWRVTAHQTLGGETRNYHDDARRRGVGQVLFRVVFARACVRAREGCIRAEQSALGPRSANARRRG